MKNQGTSDYLLTYIQPLLSSSAFCYIHFTYTGRFVNTFSVTRRFKQVAGLEHLNNSLYPLCFHNLRKEFPLSIE